MTRRTLILFAWAFSVISIAGAWTFQLLGYQPCQLCYWQRGPHYAIIVIGLVALVTRWYWLAWVGALAAAATSAIGFYHTGVERHWWPGPASCTGSGVSGLSTEDLVGQLTQAPLQGIQLQVAAEIEIQPGANGGGDDRQYGYFFQ